MSSMRDEFEAWASAENMNLTICQGSQPNAAYLMAETNFTWRAWQASRESQVIDLSDLSKCFSPNDCGDWAMWLNDVRILAQSVGIKVKL